MKKKEKQTLHAKTLQELKVQLGQVREALFLLKLDKSLMKLKNTRSIFEKRKELARILTILNVKGKDLPAGRQG